MNQEILAVQQLEGNLWVDARTLHANLEVSTDFTHWVKRRIVTCRAIEGRDFKKAAVKNGENRPAHEFLLSLDLGKHIAMLERNDKGHEIREYFIAAEEKLRAASPVLPTLSPMEMLAQLAMGMVAAEKKLNTVSDRVDVFEGKLDFFGGEVETVQVKMDVNEAKTVAIEQRLEDMTLDPVNQGKIHVLGQELGDLIGYAKAWGMFKRHFEIAKYSHLPNSKFEDGMRFLRCQIEAYRGPTPVTIHTGLLLSPLENRK